MHAHTFSEKCFGRTNKLDNDGRNDDHHSDDAIEKPTHSLLQTATWKWATHRALPQMGFSSDRISFRVLNAYTDHPPIVTKSRKKTKKNNRKSADTPLLTNRPQTDQSFSSSSFILSLSLLSTFKLQTWKLFAQRPTTLKTTKNLNCNRTGPTFLV